jgi:bifunctional non-homologous end joining protein LigD
LNKHFDKLSRKTSSLAVVPRDPGLRETHWTEPKMIAEVAFTEWISDGSIRHPSVQGLREDKNPRDVIREQPSGDTAKSKRKSKSSR